MKRKKKAVVSIMSLNRSKNISQQEIKQFAKSQERDIYMNSFQGRQVLIEHRVQLLNFLIGS